MEAVPVITTTAPPLRRSDVDTDQIIPAEWLKRVERTGFGEGLFDSWRKDPTFVLNDRQARAPVPRGAGPTSGAGPSRQHGVWALMDHGFRPLISPGCGVIFRKNRPRA